MLCINAVTVAPAVIVSDDRKIQIRKVNPVASGQYSRYEGATFARKKENPSFIRLNATVASSAPTIAHRQCTGRSGR